MKAFFYSLLVLCAFAAGFYAWAQYEYTAPGELTEPVTLVFPPGTRFEQIADQMAEKGVITHPNLFKVQVFLSGKSSHFKAGEYAFAPHISPASVAEMIASGKSVMHHFTIPEGLMTVEIFDLLRKETALAGEITLDIREGELLPETYFYSYGDKRNDILMRMKHAMEKTLTEAWEGRAQGLPINTPQQAITLASIVEKETGVTAERPHVASVYINRLNKGMLLQADPTTAYAVTMGKSKLDRPLSLKDLALDSPYNTYHVTGLPPGPIANPGKASIIATLHPLTTQDLYFVATGKGGHYFAQDMAQHEANVKLYRESQKSK
jgi:UPF0755 protein